MNLLKRIKNLWKLSAYRPAEVGERGQVGDTIASLTKDFPTVKQKLATIIPEDKPDIFAQDDPTR